MDRIRWRSADHYCSTDMRVLIDSLLDLAQPPSDDDDIVGVPISFIAMNSKLQRHSTAGRCSDATTHAESSVGLGLLCLASIRSRSSLVPNQADLSAESALSITTRTLLSTESCPHSRIHLLLSLALANPFRGTSDRDIVWLPATSCTFIRPTSPSRHAGSDR